MGEQYSTMPRETQTTYALQSYESTMIWQLAADVFELDI